VRQVLNFIVNFSEKASEAGINGFTLRYNLLRDKLSKGLPQIFASCQILEHQ